MGSIHSANCKCGFKASFSIGGDRATFKTRCFFPFYCETCGLVSVNIHARSLFCPQCKSKVVMPYGQPPISLVQKSDQFSPTIQAFRHEANLNGNFCPSCKKMDLVFSSPDVMFD